MYSNYDYNMLSRYFLRDIPNFSDYVSAITRKRRKKKSSWNQGKKKKRKK